MHRTWSILHSDPKNKHTLHFSPLPQEGEGGVRGALEIEARDLFGIWILEFGILDGSKVEPHKTG